MVAPSRPGRAAPQIVHDEGSVSGGLAFRHSRRRQWVVVTAVLVALCSSLVAALRLQVVLPRSGLIAVVVAAGVALAYLYHLARGRRWAAIVVGREGVQIGRHPLVPWADITSIEPTEGRYLDGPRNRGFRVARITIMSGAVPHQVACQDLEQHPAALLSLLTWAFEHAAVVDHLGSPELARSLDQVTEWAVQRDREPRD